MNAAHALGTAAAGLILSFVTPHGPPTPSRADPPVDPVTWQSAGDSYSSGEGVFGNTGACAQSEWAYGPQAVFELRVRRWEISDTFTACTGQLVPDYFVAREAAKGSLWDWGREQGGPEQVDVITMSFGGNDIGFADVISDCLVGLPDSWGEFVGGGIASSLTGCDTSESELDARVDALLDPTQRDCTGTRSNGTAGFDCDLNLGARRGSIIDFYFDLATQRLTERGLLVVVGYPRIFAPVDQWPGWIKVSCQFVKRGDTEKLGRVAEHLNDKLREAVARANQALGTERVLFVDRMESFSDGRHELCGTNDDWLNGVTTTRGEGVTLRWLGSFHPNADGHADTAQQVVSAVDERFDRSADPPDAVNTFSSSSVVLPEGVCGFGDGPVNLIDGHWEDADGRTVDIDETVTGDLDSVGGPETVVALLCSGGGTAVWSAVVVEWGQGGLTNVDFELLTDGVVADGGDWLGRHDLLAVGEGELVVGLTTNAETHPTCCPPFEYQITLGVRDGELVRLGASLEVTFETYIPGRLHRVDLAAGEITFEPWYETSPEFEFFDYVFRKAAEPMTIATSPSLVVDRLIDPPVRDIAAFADYVNRAAEPEFVQIAVENGHVTTMLPYFESGGTGEGADYEYCRAIAPPLYDEIGECDASSGSAADPLPGDDLDYLPPQLAVDVLTNYLLKAGARDYATAWSMLSTTYQRKYGGYDKFTAFWDRVDIVGINSTDVEVIGVLPESKYTVTTDLYFQLVDGSTSSEIVEVDVLITADRREITDYRFIRSY